MAPPVIGDDARAMARDESRLPRERDGELARQMMRPGRRDPLPADSRIVVTSNRRGTEILFPAARNPGVATSLTFFLLLWLGSIALQVYFHAPLVFPIVTGIFGLLILIGVLDLWLEVTRVTVDAGTLNWAKGYLSPGRDHGLTASEIAEVNAQIGMQAGTTVYYDVVVTRKGGKKIRVGRSLRDKREAQWLAATIQKALG